MTRRHGDRNGDRGRRNLRLKSSVRRAIERAGEQLGASIHRRLEGIGIPPEESVKLQPELRPFLDSARTLTITSLAQYAEEGDELAAQVTRFLARFASDDDDVDAITVVMDQMALAGILEGIIIGVAYVTERGIGERERWNNRPGR